MTDCIFCKIAGGQIPATMVHEDDDVLAFEDIRPLAPTHVIVIPRRHIPTLDDAAEADATVLGRMLLAAKQVAAQRGLSKGYRLVMNVQAGAGQVVFHVHLHLIGGRALTWPPG